MGEIWAAWGVFVAGVAACRLLVGDVAHAVMARRMAGLPGGGLGPLVIVGHLTGLSLIPWPLYAREVILHWSGRPSIFMLIVYAVLGWVVGVVVARVAGDLAGWWMMSSERRLVGRRRLFERLVVVAAIALPLTAYYLAWWLS